MSQCPYKQCTVAPLSLCIPPLRQNSFETWRSAIFVQVSDSDSFDIVVLTHRFINVPLRINSFNQLVEMWPVSAPVALGGFKQRANSALNPISHANPTPSSLESDMKKF